MSFQVQKIDRSQTIEITVINNQSKVYRFGDIDTTLNKIVMHGISLHTDALVKSFSGKTVLPLAAMRQGFLTICNPQDEQPNKRLPLETLLLNQNAITWFEPKVIELGRCFVDLPNSGALVMPGDGFGYSLPFTFYYTIFDPALHANLK